MPRKPNLKPCSRPGCTRKVVGRGLCASHYTMWHRNLTYSVALPDSRKMILEALPGTIQDVQEATGLVYETVRRHIRALHDEKLIHVNGSQPPSGKMGGRHVDIYVDGPGQDRRASKREKREFALATRRKKHFVTAAKRYADPLLMITAGRAMELA